MLCGACVYPRCCHWAMDLLGFQPVFLMEKEMAIHNESVYC